MLKTIAIAVIILGTLGLEFGAAANTDQTQNSVLKKVTGGTAVTIFKAIIYAGVGDAGLGVVGSPKGMGFTVTDVACPDGFCSFLFNNVRSEIYGTELGASEFLQFVRQCKGASASRLDCRGKGNNYGAAIASTFTCWATCR